MDVDHSIDRMHATRYTYETLIAISSGVPFRG
jgi:hypothetical protein